MAEELLPSASSSVDAMPADPRPGDSQDELTPLAEADAAAAPSTAVASTPSEVMGAPDAEVVLPAVVTAPDGAAPGAPAPDVPAPARPHAHPQLGSLGLLVLALALIGGAQYLFRKNFNTFSAGGAILALLSILSFSLAAASAQYDPATSANTRAGRLFGRLITRLQAGSWRLLPLLLAAGMIGVLLVLLAAQPPLASYNKPALLWVAAIGLYLLAVAGPERLSRSSLRLPALALRLPSDRRWLLAAGIVLLGLLLRVGRLSDFPATVGGDEGSQGLDAVAVLKGEINNPFTLGWLSVPTMAGYFNAITIKLFGNTILGLRLMWALFGSATVLLMYLLVRRLHGRPLALMTAALLATYHYHIHYSRLGATPVADPFFIALALLFFFRGYDGLGLINWALAGVAVGVSQYSYAGARFTVVLMGALLVYYLLREPRRFWREHRRGALVLIGAAVLTAAPMIQVAIRYPDDYNARINQVGIIQNGWLEREQGFRGEGAFPILVDQFRHAVLSYNAYMDNVIWYGLGLERPLFDWVAGALFLLGLGYATLRIHDRRLMPMVAWWWGGIILGGMLTVSPPSSMRIVTTSVPAVFFVALALLLIWRTLERAVAWPPLRRAAFPFAALAVFGLSFISVRWYFQDYSPRRIYGSGEGMVATDLGLYASRNLGPDWRIYFFGAPRMVYRGFSTIPYLAPEVEAKDFDDPLQPPGDPGLAKPDKNAAFIFLPHRAGDLAIIRSVYPGGTLEQVRSPLPDAKEPLYFIYKVPRELLRS
jgi:hypothetical protein